MEGPQGADAIIERPRGRMNVMVRPKLLQSLRHHRAKMNFMLCRAKRVNSVLSIPVSLTILITLAAFQVATESPTVADVLDRDRAAQGKSSEDSNNAKECEEVFLHEFLHT